MDYAARLTEMIEMRNSFKTMQEIGNTFGISRERVRQLIGHIKIVKPKKQYIKKPKKPLHEKVMEQIDTTSNPPHWIWTGRKNSVIPIMGTTKSSFSVQRYLYKHFVGPVNQGVFVYRTCGSKTCVNPDHLAPAKYPISNS